MKDTLSEPTLSVPFDVHLLQRLLSILITNAIWLSTPEATIWIEVGIKSRWVGSAEDGRQKGQTQLCLHIPDLKLPEPDRKQIFQFRTIERLRNQYGSQFGLGFSFCELIMKTFGGQIVAKESRFSGTAFCLEFMESSIIPSADLLVQPEIYGRTPRSDNMICHQ